MTEEEARTKWCPKIQITAINYTDIVEYNDNRGNDCSDYNCIASHCMMWQWSFFGVDTSRAGKHQAKTGYCGLAK